MNKSPKTIPEWLNYGYTRGLRSFISRYRISPAYNGDFFASLYENYIDTFYMRANEEFDDDYVEFNPAKIAEENRTDKLFLIRRLEHVNRQNYGHYIKDGKTIELFKTDERDGKKIYLINMPLLDTIQAERFSAVSRLIAPIFLSAVLAALGSQFIPLLIR